MSITWMEIPSLPLTPEDEARIIREIDADFDAMQGNITWSDHEFWREHGVNLGHA